MALFRLHRGSLKASMETCTEVKTMEDIFALIPEDLKVNATAVDICIAYYNIYDERVKWLTYIVTIKNMPVGFINEPLAVIKKIEGKVFLT